MSETVAVLRLSEGRFELSYPAMKLVVRGPHPEWVLEAAAEIVAQTERLRAEGTVEQLELLAGLGESSSIEIDAAKYEASSRFEAVPQCLVSMGDNDYRWVAAPGRQGGRPFQRVHDLSLTRNDTFLADEPGAAAPTPTKKTKSR